MFFFCITQVAREKQKKCTGLDENIGQNTCILTKLRCAAARVQFFAFPRKRPRPQKHDLAAIRPM